METPPALDLMEKALKNADSDAITELTLPGSPNYVDWDFIFSTEGLLWLKKLFSKEWFLKTEAPRFVYYWLEQQWEDIPEPNRAELLTIIVTSYPKMEHWNSCFEACEALGQLYANESSYRALTEFASYKREIEKAYVPHGLLHWCLKAKPSATRLAEVIKIAEKLSRDPSDLVRKEASTALQKLKEL